MKQNNNRFIFFLFGILILIGIIFVAAKEITPETTAVENEITPQK